MKRVIHFYFLFFLCLFTQAQNEGVKIIDNKGTIKNINKVSASNSTPSSNIEGDIWFDTSVATNTTIKIWDNNISGNSGWREFIDGVHKGTAGSIFFAGTDGVPTENNKQLFWDNTNNRLFIGNPLTGNNKLTVNGQTRSWNFNSGNGTFNNPAFRFASDPNTGIFRPNADNIAFTTGGTTTLNLNDSQGRFYKNLKVDGKFIDSSGDAGSNGQILSSTGTGTDWKYVEKPTIVLNRNFNGSNILQGVNNTYSYFPLNSSHVLVNNTDFYEVANDGRIRIKVSGNYLMSAELSTSNMPSGSTKYIIAAFLNGTGNPSNIIGYLSRGFVTLSSPDWWGSTGTLIYPLSANDIVHFRYVINNNGNNLRARFLNISITKL